MACTCNAEDHIMDLVMVVPPGFVPSDCPAVDLGFEPCQHCLDQIQEFLDSVPGFGWVSKETVG